MYYASINQTVLFMLQASSEAGSEATIQAGQDLLDAAAGNPGDPIFSTSIRVEGNIVFGLILCGDHNDDFGKLFLFVRKGGSFVLMRFANEFIHFLSRPIDQKLFVLDVGLKIVGDVSVTLNGDESLTFTRHDGFFVAETIPTVTLTFVELGYIEIMCVEMSSRFHTFEVLEFVTGEAIRDVHTECRMFAQGSCRGCRQMGNNDIEHRCTSVIGDRLDRCLRDSLLVDDKWPFSRGMQMIYERLTPHGNFFRRHFRHSMAWNRYFTHRFKTTDLPDYIE